MCDFELNYKSIEEKFKINVKDFSMGIEPEKFEADELVL
jgi:hypothetical protein